MAHATARNQPSGSIPPDQERVSTRMLSWPQRPAVGSGTLGEMTNTEAQKRTSLGPWGAGQHELGRDGQTSQSSEHDQPLLEGVRNVQDRRHCCHKPKEDYLRGVKFVTNQSGDRPDDQRPLTEIGATLFDTGTKYDNFMSSEFAALLNYDLEETHECRDNLRAKRPWYKRVAAKVWRALHKLHWTTHDGSPVVYRTADRSPLKIVGKVEGIRWWGQNEDRCSPGVWFYEKFERSSFLVVENLAYDAIISLNTMNDLGLRTGSKCSAAFLSAKPQPAERSAYVEQQRRRDEQEREKREDRAAAKKTETSSTSKTSTQDKPKN